MKLVHLVIPKQTKAVAEANAALRSRKLPKPPHKRPLTALEWVKKINRDLHFAVIHAVSDRRQ
jgi:hypothetical protein